jgi:hypothetical protein
VTAAHAVARSLRKPVNCFNADVIATYKKIVSHWPTFKKPEDSRCHPFFLTPNRKFRAQDRVWFKPVPIGYNQLAEYTKLLAKDVPALAGKRISNKTG